MPVALRQYAEKYMKYSQKREREGFRRIQDYIRNTMEPAMLGRGVQLANEIFYRNGRLNFDRWNQIKNSWLNIRLMKPVTDFRKAMERLFLEYMKDGYFTSRKMLYAELREMGYPIRTVKDRFKPEIEFKKFDFEKGSFPEELEGRFKDLKIFEEEDYGFIYFDTNNKWNNWHFVGDNNIENFGHNIGYTILEEEDEAIYAMNIKETSDGNNYTYNNVGNGVLDRFGGGTSKEDRTDNSQEIMGGALLFKGTRIPIYMVENLLNEGISPEQIAVDYYPTLSIHRIRELENSILITEEETDAMDEWDREFLAIEQSPNISVPLSVGKITPEFKALLKAQFQAGIDPTTRIVTFSTKHVAEMQKIFLKNISKGLGPDFTKRKFLEKIASGVTDPAIRKKLEYNTMRILRTAYGRAAAASTSLFALRNSKIISGLIRVADGRPCPACLVEGSMILMGSKYWENILEFKDIKDVEVGDLVWSHRERVQKVIDKSANPREDVLVTVETEDGKFHVSQTHKVFLKDGSLKQAGDLKVGDEVMNIEFD